MARSVDWVLILLRESDTGGGLEFCWDCGKFGVTMVDVWRWCG